MAHNLMVCLVFFFGDFPYDHKPVSRGCLAGGWNGQSTHQPGAVWGWHGLWSLPIWIDNRKNFGYKVKIILFFLFRKMELNIYFLNQMISPRFLVIRYEKDWLNTNPSEVGVLLGALLFWTSEVVAFRIGKPKNDNIRPFFFYFPRFGEIFWLTVNMAWSCWNGLWICIKWDILMATFHFGTQDVSYDGPWCTRPIAYSLYRSMVGSICVQVSARCALIWLSSTASGWGT